MSVYFDLNTFLLYIFIGCFCAVYLRYVNTVSNNKSFNIYGYAILSVILILFAIGRSVNSFKLGGTDSFMYESGFLRAFSKGYRFNDQDVLFGIFTKGIRQFTDNVYVYRGICYTIIVLGYMVFLRKFCNPKISYIPFIMIMVPYLRSFNTMRNSIAISIFLIGLVLYYNKKYFWSIIFILSTILIHRMSALYVVIIPFIYIFEKVNFKSKKKLSLFLISYILLVFVLSLALQGIIVSRGLLDNNVGADAYYIQSSLEGGPLAHWPMVFPQILLFFALIIRNKFIPNTSEAKFIKLLVIFDLIMCPATLVLGMWRAIEYLYLARLIMWGYIIYSFYKPKQCLDNVVVQYLFFAGFMFWLCFRINSEWEPAGLMPYIPAFI